MTRVSMSPSTRVWCRRSTKLATTKYVLTGHEFAQSLPELVRLNDEPLNFANSVHIYAVSKLAKEHVTVVLTGRGCGRVVPRVSAVPRAKNFRETGQGEVGGGASVVSRGTTILVIIGWRRSARTWH